MRHQKIGAARLAQQCIVEHPREGARTGLVGGRIECADTQRRPDARDQPCRLILQGQPLRDRHSGRAGVGALLLQPLHQPDHRPSMRPGQPASGHQADGQIERVKRRRQRRGLKKEAARADQFHRHSQHGLLRIDAHPAHQCQSVAIGTDQQVLTVINFDRTATEGQRQGASPTPGLRRSVDHDHRLACLDQRHGCRQSGPAGTDHDDRRSAAAHEAGADLGADSFGGRPLTQVRQASSSLRIGVSEVRRSSTRKPSRSISSSSVE